MPPAESSQRAVRRGPVFPGGIIATRRAVRRRGGLVGVGVAALLWLISVVVKAVVGGPIGGALSFGIKVIAVPFMPVVGIPADTSGNRLLYAVIASALVWWFIGQTAGAKVTKKVMASWREWTREFIVMSFAICVGAVLSFVLAAFMLGAV